MPSIDVVLSVEFTAWGLLKQTAEEYAQSVESGDLEENEAEENLIALALGMMEVSVK